MAQSGQPTITTLYVAGMEIELSNSTETKRTIYYSMGRAFRVIESGDATYAATDLYYGHGDLS